MLPSNKSSTFIKVDQTGNALVFLKHYERASPFQRIRSEVQQLNLGKNELTCMKPFKKLFCSIESSLTELTLRDNRLNQFPEEILVLKNLTTLSLCNNRLQYIPQGSLSQLSGLIWLNLGMNKLSSLPVDLVCCTKLRGLDIHSNKFTEFPRPVYFLTELEILAAQDNKITHVSVELGRLQKLDSLNLSNNQLAHIPAGLVHNPPLRLSHLYLGENPIRTIDLSFLSHTSLVYLDLSSCNLGHLSAEFFKHLSKVQRLNLSMNLLRRLPPEIGLLTQLQDLNLNDNALIELPHAISKLTKLVKLGLARNQIKALPPYMFSRMFDLRKLDLQQNQLTYLPLSILALMWCEKTDFFGATFRHIVHPCCATSDLVCDRRARLLTIEGVGSSRMRYLDGIIYHHNDRVRDVYLQATSRLTRTWPSATDMMTHILPRKRIPVQNGLEKIKNILSLKELCIRNWLNSSIDCRDEILQQQVFPSNFAHSLLQKYIVDNARCCDFCQKWYAESRFQVGYVFPRAPVRIDVCSAECAFKVVFKMIQPQRGITARQDLGFVRRTVLRVGEFIKESRRATRRGNFANFTDDGPNPPCSETYRFELTYGILGASLSQHLIFLDDEYPTVQSLRPEYANAVRLANF